MVYMKWKTTLDALSFRVFAGMTPGAKFVFFHERERL